MDDALPPDASTPRYADLGAAVRWLRLSQGLSLRTLARQLGLAAHSGLVDYERGHRLLPADLLAGYERVFGTNARSLRALREAALAARADDAVHDRRRPAELPADLPDFVGRQAELDRLTGAVGSGMSRVLAVSGMPGSGKTSLAVHLAHRLRVDYPDGQLFLDLHGAVGPAVVPAKAVRHVLRACGVPERGWPADEDELLSTYRSVLHDRRILVVLDDAASEAQVRPLLPAGSAALVIVTSRNPLAGLECAVRCPLDVMTVPDATAVLERIVGAGRVRAEPDAAARIVGRCGGLPLAIRAVASRLATWPAWPLADCADALAAEHERLAWLEFGDRAVRGAFEVSYRSLSPRARRLFRRLSLLPGTEFGTAVAATLVRSAHAVTERLLDEIVTVGLLRWGSRPGRYRLHDLTRLYARGELNAVESDTARRLAEQRALTWLLRTARQAATQLDPSGVIDSQRVERAVADDAGGWSTDDAVRWLDTERESLLTAIGRAHVLDLPTLVFPLLPALPWFYDLRCHWDDQRQLAETALALARAHHDPIQELIALNAVALARLWAGRFAEAVASCQEAILLARRTNDGEGEAWARDRLGVAWRELGQYDRAVAELRYAAILAHECGAWWKEASILDHLGHAYDRNDQPDLAVAAHQRAATAFALLGHERGEAMARIGLGRGMRRTGRAAEAVDTCERARTVLGQADDQWGVALAQYELALAHRDLGDTGTAVALLREAADTFAVHRDFRRQATVLVELERQGVPV